MKKILIIIIILGAALDYVIAGALQTGLGFSKQHWLDLRRRTLI